MRLVYIFVRDQHTCDQLRAMDICDIITELLTTHESEEAIVGPCCMAVRT